MAGHCASVDEVRVAFRDRGALVTEHGADLKQARAVLRENRRAAVPQIVPANCFRPRGRFESCDSAIRSRSWSRSFAFLSHEDVADRMVVTVDCLSVRRAAIALEGKCTPRASPFFVLRMRRLIVSKSTFDHFKPSSSPLRRPHAIETKIAACIVALYSLAICMTLSIARRPRGSGFALLLR